LKPTTIRIRSFAKVNLGLTVLDKRSDGYHEIRTIFQTIGLHDLMEIRPSDTLQLTCSGLDGVPMEENTVWRAAAGLARIARPPAGAAIRLEKRIPAGSGLGGGSSNAAAALLGLCRFWNLDLPAKELHTLAAAIGSDVAFFLKGGTALGSGRGEELRPIPEIREAHLVVVCPGVAISTAKAYQSLSLMLTYPQTPNKIQGLCARLQDDPEWPAGIFNDFETSILPAYPAVREAKDFLAARGATATLLSGSGSSVFGFFSDEESARAASRSPMARESWRVFPTKTLSRVAYFQGMFG